MISRLPAIHIVPFRPEHAIAFRDLNLEWLQGNGLLEDEDLAYLADPESRILKPGGSILVAEGQHAVLGTIALLKLDPQTFEIAKLAVAVEARGAGLGRRLALAAISTARSHGARRLVLSSSSKLAAAVALYESLGFRHSQPHEASVPYKTADVHMDLVFGDEGESPNPSLQRTLPG